MPQESESASSAPTSLDRLTGRGSLFRNSIAAVVATGADFLVVVALVHVGWMSVPFATFCGCIVGAVVNFTMNRVWTFGSDLAYARQIGRYSVVSGASALWNAGAVAALLLLSSAPYPLLWVIARVGVFVAWNYPLHRYYVFPAARSASR